FADPSARAFQDLKAIGRAFGMPTTLLIDPKGCEIATIAGPAEWASDDAIKLINAALERYGDYALMFRLRPTPSATFARLCRFFWAASSTWTIADVLSAFMRSILAATAICTSAISEPTKAVAIDTGSIPVPFLRQVYQRNVNATGEALTLLPAVLYLTKWFTIQDRTSIELSPRSPIRRGALCSPVCAKRKQFRSANWRNRFPCRFRRS